MSEPHRQALAHSGGEPGLKHCRRLALVRFTSLTQIKTRAAGEGRSEHSAARLRMPDREVAVAMLGRYRAFDGIIGGSCGSRGVTAWSNEIGFVRLLTQAWPRHPELRCWRAMEQSSPVLRRSRIDLGYLSRRVDRTFLAGLDRLSQKAGPEKAMNGSTLRAAPRADEAYRIAMIDVPTPSHSAGYRSRP